MRTAALSNRSVRRLGRSFPSEVRVGHPRGAGDMKLLALVSLAAIAALVLLLVWKPQEKAAVKQRDLVILCAAGLRAPLDAIAEQYEKEYGLKAQFRYGASETLLSQLGITQDGDIFIPADADYVKKARAKGLTAEELPLATMRPVIAVAKGNPKNIKTLDDLLRPDVRLAIANPEAAVGKLSKELLEKAGKWGQIQERVKAAGSSHTTVIEVANAVKAGTKADAGIIWDAVAAQIPQLEALHVPELDAGSSQVTLAVLKCAKDPTAALRFGRYVTARDKGLPILKKLGYGVIEGDVWAYHPTVTLFSGAVNRLAIEETVADFEKREGATVNRVYNGCGTLLADMRAIQMNKVHKGFPDAYMACDVSFMSPVNDWFPDPKKISETDMVIVTRKDNPQGIKTLEDLARPGLKVGLADPTQSTLGALTQRLLKDLGVQDTVQKNVCFTSPTADMVAMQLVEGKLDAAVVYQVNTTKFKGKLEVVCLPGPNSVAVQPYAVAKETEHPWLMRRLREAIESAESRRRFESSGFRWLVKDQP